MHCNNDERVLFVIFWLVYEIPMSPMPMKRLFALLALCAGAVAAAERSGAAAQQSPKNPILVATVETRAGADVIAASGALRVVQIEGNLRKGDDRKSGGSPEWTMLLLGAFLIIAITGRRARSMFD